MQKTKINNNGNIARRNRGKKTAIPFLRIKPWRCLVASFAILIVIFASGCKNSQDELVLIDPITDKGELASGMDEDIASGVSEFQSESAIDSAIEKTVCYVHVCGAVLEPGVYQLKPTNHIVDGIEAAGGFCDDADMNCINLATVIEDGMQIYVPTREEAARNRENSTEQYVTVRNGENQTGEAQSGTGQNNFAGNLSSGGNSKTNETSGQNLVNINIADEATLMTLPGIGQAKASKIIIYRQNNGAFTQISDIMKVDGIKTGMYDKIKDKICVN